MLMLNYFIMGFALGIVIRRTHRNKSSYPEDEDGLRDEDFSLFRE